MIKFLRNNQQIFIFLIFLYGLLAVFTAFFSRPEGFHLSSPFELPLLLDFYLRTSGHGNVMLGFAFLVYLQLIIAGFFLVRLGINYQIISQRSQFPALFLIALTSFSFGHELFSGAGIASLFLLLSLERVLGSIEKKGLSYRFLDAGIFLACGSIFYQSMIFLLPSLWVAQILLRPPSWRELSFTLMGVFLPIIFFLAGVYLLDRSVPDVISHIGEWIFLKKVIEADGYFLMGMSLYLLMMIIGSFFALRKFSASKIQLRKLYQLLLFLFINILLMMLVIPSAGVESLFLLSIPSAILLSIYFAECRNSFVNRLIFFILLAAPVLINVLT